MSGIDQEAQQFGGSLVFGQMFPIFQEMPEGGIWTGGMKSFGEQSLGLPQQVLVGRGSPPRGRIDKCLP